MMNNNKKILIEEGFTYSILSWILIIISEYCKQKNIKEIIIEKKQKDILKNNLIKNQLKSFNVIYTDDLLPFYLKNDILLKLILLPKSVIFSLFWKKFNYINSNWFDYQFYHSIIDTQQSLGKDGDIEANYFTVLKSIYLNFRKKKIAEYLAKKNISALVSSHNVYSVKTFNSVFRKKKIPVFCHAVWNLYKLPFLKDENWNNFYNFEIRKKIFSNLKISKVNSYWKKKFLGKGDYYDSNLSFKKKKFNDKVQNVVMLHIFRDSPFIHLDRKRIFLNYIEWIDKTIKILKKSKNDWYFKIHPNSKKWGENPIILLKKLIKKNEAKNIIILKEGNIKLMKNLKKIVTFAGSVTEESVSMGIKPITISETAIYNYDKNLVFKPRTFNDYEKLLLSKNLKSFRLKKNQKKIAKKIIYSSEKLMSLRKDLNATFFFRTEKYKKHQDYLKVNRKLKKNISFLRKNGYLLSHKLTHSLSKEGLKLIKEA